MQKNLPIAFLLLATLTTRAAHAAPTDLSRATAQFRAYCLSPATDHGDRLLDDVELPKTSVNEARKLLASLQPDGSWSDIDYASTARSSWQPFTHLTRVLSLALFARRDNAAPDESRAALAAANNALAFWASHDFNCTNWWYNEIGVPKILGTIALLLDPDLPQPTRTYITATVMVRSKLGAMTGQNRVWIAGNALMRGLLTEDDHLVAAAADIIHKEIVVSLDEGIQPDWSFHQHGPQQQLGNYGEAFAIDNVRWAVILRNTRYALPPAKLDILRHYLLDGQNWITWRGVMDISACGRQLFPNSPRSKAAVLRAVMLTMAVVDADHAPDYNAFAARNGPDHPDAPNDLRGTRAFYDSDYLLHRSATVAASLRMYSSRIFGGETVNSENLSGNHLADGATFLYRTGDEYTDIFPVWNWRAIPGTTALLDDSPLIWKSHSTKSKVGDGTPFVGVLSTGPSGCAAMDFLREPLSAHKAWFFDGDTIVCLGAAIHADADAPVITTLNQSLLQGAVTLHEGQSTRELPPNTDKSLPNVSAIDHAGFTYTFPEPTTVTLTTTPATGNWKAVFTTPATPKADVTKPLFFLRLDHGSHPTNAAYAYAISPTAIPSAGSWKILVNTPTLQAVAIGDDLFAVVWQPGTFDLAGHHFTVDHPCLLALPASAGTSASPQLFIADPTHTLSAIAVKFDDHAYPVPLPAALQAGATTNVGLR